MAVAGLLSSAFGRSSALSLCPVHGHHHGAIPRRARERKGDPSPIHSCAQTPPHPRPCAPRATPPSPPPTTPPPSATTPQPSSLTPPTPPSPSTAQPPTSSSTSPRSSPSSSSAAPLAHARTHRHQDAERDCTRTLALSPNNVKALFRRAQARAALSLLDSARQGPSVPSPRPRLISPHTPARPIRPQTSKMPSRSSPQTTPWPQSSDA